MDVLHNEALLAAIERMNKVNDRASREAVLDLVITQAQFISPVEDKRSAATKRGSLPLSAITKISLGPAIISIDTRPKT